MRLFTFDFETFLIRPGNEIPRPVALAYMYDEGEPRVLHCAYDREECARVLLEAFSDESTACIAHNAKFDLLVAANWFPEALEHILQALIDCRVSDTMLREKIINMSRGESYLPVALSACVGRWFNTDISDSKKGGPRTNYSEVFPYPLEEWPESYVKYAADDVRWTAKLWVEQALCDDIGPDGEHGRYEDEPFWADEFRQVSAAFHLGKAAARGFRRDEKRILELEARLFAELDEGYAELEAMQKEMGFDKRVIRKNGSEDRKFVQELITEAYNGDPPMTKPSNTYPEGQVSWSKETKEESGHPVLMRMAELADSKTEYSSFIPRLKANIEYPITYGVDILKETGRLSTYKPSLSNLPRRPGVRECFLPREGYVLVACDYDTLEIRCWAAACRALIGYSTVGDAYDANPNHDPHSAMGAAVLGVTYEEFIRLKNAGDLDAKKARQFSKPVNFGKMGGMGVRTMLTTAKKQGVVMTEEKGYELEQVWFDVNPEGKEYFDEIQACVVRFGGLRLFWSSNRLRTGTFTELANYCFQGPAADGMKSAAIKVSHESMTDKSSALWGSHLLLTIHDELIMESPEDMAPYAAMRMKEIMETTMQDLIEVPIKATPALMRRWYKGAEPVYDSNNLLVPWEPET